MRSDLAPASVFAASRTVYPVISAWRGDDLLAASVPASDASIEWRGSSGRVPPTLTFDVPNVAEWRPGTDLRHPLAPFGQRLSVVYVVRFGEALFEIPLGWYQVQGWEPNGAALKVEALGMLQRVSENRFVSPRTPPASGTFGSEIRDVCDGLPVDLTDAPADRSLPSGLVWREDRLDALATLLDSWPADAYTDDDGVLRVVEPFEIGSPVVTWQHGESGAYIEAETTGSRDDVHNAVVASGEESEGAEVWAMARFEAGDDPLRWDGPFGKKVRFYSSPLLTTREQCLAAARTILDRERLPAQEWKVTAPPDPRIEIGDTARIVTEDADATGLVTAISLPITATGGAATYTVSTSQGG